MTIDGGTILFRDYQPLDDGYAEVFPFTLILNAKPPRADGTPALSDSSGPTPIAVRCSKQARLKFDRPLAEGVSHGGLKLEGARLVGDVTIYRPPSAVGKLDGVSIVTSNIQIDPTQVFTLEEVQFAFGKNKGAGRNLRIDLERSQQRSGNPMEGSGFSGVDGISRIELASLKRLRLEPTGDAVEVAEGSVDSNSSVGKDADLLSDSKAPLEVSCAGPFAFDFHSNTATLNDSVRIEQQDQNRDRLNCDQLVLQFADDTGAGGTAAESGLTLETFNAKGSPAQVVSHSRSTTISGNRLSYDVSTGQFQATSNHQVTVETPEFQLLSRELNYSVPNDGSMGPVDANGPGRLLRMGSAEREPLLVKWQKRMTVHPDGTQQRVTIDGESHVHLGHDISLAAEQIELWLQQSQDEQRTPALTTQRPQDEERWDPIRVLASGGVRINTPQLNGVAQNLTATWLGNTTMVPPSQNAASDSNANATRLNTKRHIVSRVVQEGWATLAPAQSGWSTVPPAARVARQSISQPAGVRNNSLALPATDFGPKASPQVTRPATKPDEAKGKIDFKGEDVVVQLKRSGSDTEIADLKIDGNVRVTQTSGSAADSKTNTIAGSSLHLVPQADKQQRVQIEGSAGQPAQFRSDELNLDGQKIFVDQLANRIWVEGRGKLWLNPSQQANKSKPDQGNANVRSTNQLDPERLGTIDQLEVSWAAGMIFDGRKIYFEEDVAMTAKSAPDQKGSVTQSRSFSRGLSIGLTEEVRIASTNDSTKRLGSDIKIDEVILVDSISEDKQVFQLASSNNANTPFQLAGTEPPTNRLVTPVVIEHTTFDANAKILERQTVIAPQATYSATSGMIRASGPGAIQLHRRGKSKSLDPSGKETSSKPSDPDAITLTHVKFDDRLIADPNKKQIQIHGQVRSLTSPVRSFDTVFDPDLETSTWPVDAVKLVCEQVQLAQWNPQSSNKPSNEIVASGNAHIINSKFEATADRVSYSQANDMLVVEGTPRSDANLWFRRNPAARPDHLVAGKILYRLSDQWTEVQNVRNVKIKSK